MIEEVAFCASGPAQGNASLGSISLNDLQTGNSVFSLKQTGASRNGIGIVETGQGLGGVILCAQTEKAMMHTYSFQKVVDHVFACYLTHYFHAGSSNVKSGFTRKGVLSCSGQTWSFCCLRDRKWKNLSMGGLLFRLSRLSTLRLISDSFWYYVQLLGGSLP